MLCRPGEPGGEALEEGCGEEAPLKAGLGPRQNLPGVLPAEFPEWAKGFTLKVSALLKGKTTDADCSVLGCAGVGVGVCNTLHHLFLKQSLLGCGGTSPLLEEPVSPDVY